jgi:biopolymer transport protein ExbD
MAYQQGSDEDLMSEINVTPLVDVMLILLVVFIITAPLLAPQSIKINLPRTESLQHKQMPHQISLLVDAQGHVEWEKKQVTDQMLSEMLRLQSGSPEFQLQIEADKTVPYGRIAELMALAQHAGVVRLSFITLAR